MPVSEQQIATNAEGEFLDYNEGKQYPVQQQYALCRCGKSILKIQRLQTRRTDQHQPEAVYRVLLQSPGGLRGGEAARQ